MRYYFHHQQPQQLWQRMLQQHRLSRDHNVVQQQLKENLPRHQRQFRCFVTNSGNNSAIKSDPSFKSASLDRRNRSHTFDMFHPQLRNRLRPHRPGTFFWFSSSSFSGFDPSGPDPVIPPTSSLYDPKTNEPAGLRVVVEGMKRMESQITNIENDIDSIKNVVKKIRESNGKTEARLDVIEEFADTMQQDLYLAMDMVRALTEAVVPKDEDYQKYNDTAPPNPNIASAKAAAAAAKARAIRQEYHNKRNTTSTTDDNDDPFQNDTTDHERRSRRK